MSRVYVYTIWVSEDQDHIVSELYKQGKLIDYDFQDSYQEED